MTLVGGRGGGFAHNGLQHLEVGELNQYVLETEKGMSLANVTMILGLTNYMSLANVTMIVGKISGFKNCRLTCRSGLEKTGTGIVRKVHENITCTWGHQFSDMLIKQKINVF